MGSVSLQSWIKHPRFMRESSIVVVEAIMVVSEQIDDVIPVLFQINPARDDVGRQ